MDILLSAQASIVYLEIREAVFLQQISQVYEIDIEYVLAVS
jgi:hypothetical protein